MYLYFSIYIMKKVLSLLVFVTILSSCWNDTTQQETQSGSQTQTGSIVEETQDDTLEENQTDEEMQEETSQETQEDENSNDDYGFARQSSQEETQTGSEAETSLEVDTQVEMSDSQEEQLIQETMDELNEFFELLENTDG